MAWTGFALRSQAQILIQNQATPVGAGCLRGSRRVDRVEPGASLAVLRALYRSLESLWNPV